MATGRVIQVIGGNLFRVALQYLGDATQWNRIAQASGTGTDPFLPVGAITTLIIPKRDSSAGGGVYAVAKISSVAGTIVNLTGADGVFLTGADGADLVGPA